MPNCFSHEALFYDSPDSFLEGTLPFLREGLARDEAMLVALPSERIAALEHELGDDAAGVTFADMAEIGRNPARIIPAWRDFANEQVIAGRRFRGIGEPIWAGRSPEELVECQHHESLLNLAFGGRPPWRLLCPYDTAGLPEVVLEEARRSHPVVCEGAQCRESEDYVAPTAVRGYDADAPPPPAHAPNVAFTRHGLGSLRRLVRTTATSAGLDDNATADLMLAVTEVATNSVLHGGGEGTAAIWEDRGTVICEVRDRGRITDPLVGRERPSPNVLRGRGMWLVNQVCDLVEIRTLPGANVVRFRLASH